MNKAQLEARMQELTEEIEDLELDILNDLYMLADASNTEVITKERIAGIAGKQQIKLTRVKERAALEEQSENMELPKQVKGLATLGTRTHRITLSR